MSSHDFIYYTELRERKMRRASIELHDALWRDHPGIMLKLRARKQIARPVDRSRLDISHISEWKGKGE